MARSLPQLLTVLVVVLGCTIWWQTTQGLRAFTWETHRRLQVEREPVTVMNIALEDHRHRFTDLSALRGKVLVVNFIYTRCPTICGVTGAAYARLQTALVQLGYADKVVLLSISLDPHYDAPDKLHGYLQRFSKQLDHSWLATRPIDPRQGDLLLQQLGVVSIPDGMGGIQHNAATHLVDQQGRLVQIIDEDKIDPTLAAIQQLLGDTHDDAG